MSPIPRRHRFWLALREARVWRRAAKIGLFVGLLQVSINQGDRWLHHEITVGLILKSILSPALSFGVAVVSTAIAHAEISTRSDSTST